MRLSTKNKDIVLVGSYVVSWAICGFLGVLFFRPGWELGLLLPLFLLSWLWLLQRKDEARVRQLKKEDLTYYGASRKAEVTEWYLTGGLVFTLSLVAIVGWLGQDSLFKVFVPAQGSFADRYDTFLAGFLLTAVFLTLSACFPAQRVILAAFASMVVLAFLLNQYFFTIHQVDVMLQVGLIISMIATLVGTSVENHASEGYSELKFWSKHKFLFYLVLFGTFTLFSYASLPRIKGNSMLIGVGIGIVVGMVCHLFSKILKRLQKRSLEKAGYLFFDQLHKHPVIYLLTMPLFSPINFFFYTYPGAVWKSLDYIQYVNESIERLFSQRARSFVTFYQPGKVNLFFAIGLFIMPLPAVSLFQNIIRLFSPSLPEYFIILAGCLFFYFGLILPGFSKIYARFCIPVIKASKPEKLYYPWIKSYPNIVCSQHLIRPKLKTRALFYKSLACPVDGCKTHMIEQYADDCDDFFRTGGLIGRIGLLDHERSGQVFLGYKFPKSCGQDLRKEGLPKQWVEKIETLDGKTFATKEALLGQLGLAKEGKETHNILPILEKHAAAVVSMWNENEKTPMNADVQELEIVGSDKLESLDGAVMGVLCELLCDQNKPKGHLKKVRLTLVGDPKLSDNTQKALNAEFGG